MPSNHLNFCRPLLLPPIFLSIRVFSNELALHIRWLKCWSLSLSPSNEYSGLISFRTDWFDVLAVQFQDPQESSPALQFESISSLALSLVSAPALTSLHDYWKGFEAYKEWNWIQRYLILVSELILTVL